MNSSKKSVTDPARIRHIVAYDGSGGEYGGPTKVALGLAEAQVRAGYSVEVLAASNIRHPKQYTQNGVQHFRFPALWVAKTHLGFAGLMSPSLLLHLLRSRRAPLVTHVHIARDLLTLPAALLTKLQRRHFVLQTHGMVDAPTRLSARILDLFATGPAMRSSQAVVTLTPDEDEHVVSLGVKRAHIHRLPNGTPISAPATPAAQRDTVLFLARLHPRKGAKLFAEAAVTLLARGRSERFVIAGPDEGDLARVQKVLSQSNSVEQIRLIGPIPPSEVESLMRRALVYVLPAEKEPFGMTILEAMSAGTPVVIHESALLAERITDAKVGLTFDGDHEQLADVIEKTLDGRAKIKSAQQIWSYVQSEFSVDAVAEKIHYLYRVETARPSHEKGGRPGD